jgi:hypothetical protein
MSLVLRVNRLKIRKTTTKFIPWWKSLLYYLGLHSIEFFYWVQDIEFSTRRALRPDRTISIGGVKLKVKTVEHKPLDHVYLVQAESDDVHVSTKKLTKKEFQYTPFEEMYSFK